MTKTQLIGRSFPIGATVVEGDVNFSLFATTSPEGSFKQPKGTR